MTPRGWPARLNFLSKSKTRLPITGLLLSLFLLALTGCEPCAVRPTSITQPQNGKEVIDKLKRDYAPVTACRVLASGRLEEGPFRLEALVSTQFGVRARVMNPFGMLLRHVLLVKSGYYDIDNAGRLTEKPLGQYLRESEPERLDFIFNLLLGRVAWPRGLGFEAREQDSVWKVLFFPLGDSPQNSLFVLEYDPAEDRLLGAKLKIEGFGQGQWQRLNYGPYFSFGSEGRFPQWVEGPDFFGLGQAIRLNYKEVTILDSVNPAVFDPGLFTQHATKK